MLNKQEFIKEIEGSLSDVRDRQDCKDWWGSHIDAYQEDGLIPASASRWTNPFLKEFEDDLLNSPGIVDAINAVLKPHKGVK
jgi:hypothetical protein